MDRFVEKQDFESLRTDLIDWAGWHAPSLVPPQLDDE